MRKVLAAVERVLTYLAVIATLLMMLLTTADATARYVFNRPITGAYEITAEYIVVAAVFLAASYAYRRGAYIRVTFVVERVSPRLRTGFNYFSQVYSLVASAIMVWATAAQALRTFASGTTSSGILAFPLGPAYALVPLGLAVMALAMLLDLPKVATGESALLHDDTTPL